MKFYKVIVEDFAIVFSFPHLSSAHALCFYRVGTFEPVDDIDIVNVLFGDMISAKPYEILPVAHLVFHFCLVGFACANPHAIVIPPGLGGSDIADHILALE